MKKWLTLAVMAWYVGMRAPSGDYPGINIHMIFGGFETKQECQEYKENTVDLLAQMIEGAVVSECRDLSGIEL